jgi:hypothetical protein
MTDQSKQTYTIDHGADENDMFKNSAGQYGFITRNGAFVIRSGDNRVISGIRDKHNNRNDIDIDDFYENEPNKKKTKRPFKINANQIGKGIRKVGNVISSVSSIAELLAPETIPVMEAVKDGATILKSSGRVVRGSGKIAKSVKKEGTNGIQGKQVEKIVNNIPVDSVKKIREMRYKGPIKKKYRATDADMTREVTKDMFKKYIHPEVKTMNVEKYKDSMFDVF